MKRFKENSHNGIDVFNENDKFLLHLSSEDLKAIDELRQKTSDIAIVMDTIPDWVEEQTNLDDCSFANFNNHLYPNDEISSDEISRRILSNERLIQKIVEELQEYDIDESDLYFENLNNAIKCCVSIKDIMGEILCDKHPKELSISKWRVAVVEQGEVYGSYGTAVHDNIKPVVEFYDMSQDKEKFPNGQFTGGRYFLETLLNSDTWSKSIDEMAESGVGLCLYGDVPAWTVAPDELAVIASWLHKVQDKLTEKTQEKVVYHGDVDVPFGYGKLAELGFDAIPEKVAEDIINARLNAIPEFNDITVKQFGVYNEGFGLSFTFTTKVDEITAEALLKHALNGLKYEFYRDDVGNTLESTLSSAQERSRQSASTDITETSGRDIDK